MFVFICFLVLMQDHPKDKELLNKPTEHYEQMETIFGGGMATGKWALGNGDPLGVFFGFPDTMDKKPMLDLSSTKPMVDLSSTKTDHQVEEKTVHKLTATTEASRAHAACTGQKRKRAAMSPDEELVLTNMTDIVNIVANALLVTGPEQVHPDLYHAVILTPGFSEEALIAAFTHLLDNNAQWNAFCENV
jgi:hypothetical protein